MNKLLSCIAVCALGAPALAQSISVDVQGPTSASPGDVVTVSVVATVTGLPSSGAIAGFGLDLDVTTGASLISNISTATVPTLTTGVVNGSADADSLDRVVGGQVSNIFGINPSVDQSTTLTLFTTELTVDPSATTGTVTVAASIADTGRSGIVLYPDIASGASVETGDPGVSVSFTDLVIDIDPVGTVCQADLDGNGSVEFQDFLILSGQFGGPGSADIDVSGAVDFQDFLILSGEFGTTGCVTR